MMNLYTILDTKAEWWGLPFYSKNDAVAMRTVFNAMRSAESEYGAHPEDFILYRIGAFDQDRGIITPEAGTCVAKLIELSLSERNEN